MEYTLIGNGVALTCGTAGCKAKIEQLHLTTVKKESDELCLVGICEDGHRTAWPLGAPTILQERRGSLRTKVSGVTFNNADGTSRQNLLKVIHPGDSLRLVKAKGQGTSVMFMLKHELGIIGSIKNTVLQEYLTKYPLQPFQIRVIQITGGTARKSTLGCNIELLPSTDEAGQVLEEILAQDEGNFVVKTEYVYLDPDTRSVYHREPHCSGMKDPEKTTLANAVHRYKARPCKRCIGEKKNEGVREHG